MRSLERAVRAVIRVMTRGAGMPLDGGTPLTLAILCAALVGWVALLPALMGPPVRPVAGDPAHGSATSPTDHDRAAGGNALGERLLEILRARERAYAVRDATVLDTVYAVDCPCLRTGRAAIATLRADDAVWRGRSFSLRVERLSRVNDSLWIAIAVLRWDSFRIEREDGRLVRAVPAARERYRFALVRPAGSGDWLLGHASPVKELPP